jgi:ferredoxin
VIRVYLALAGREQALDVAPGERLLDRLDDASLHGLVSCRAASCGVCLARLHSGAGLFAPPSDDERATLALFDADPADRLACQLRARPDAMGEAELAWLSATDEAP